MDHLSARRKLLRGSLSAPLVLTVASPSALARSSFLACITRGDNPQGVGPFAPDQKADNLYREPIQVWTICPTPPQPDPLPPGPPDCNDILYRRRGATFLFTRLDVAIPTPFILPDPINYTITETTRWQLVYFDPDSGTRTGAGYHPNGGSAVSKSCYASFITMPK